MSNPMFIVDKEELKALIKESIAEANSTLQRPKAISSELELISIPETEKLLHVTRQTINNWVKANYIHPIKVGGRVLFHKKSLIESLQKMHKK